MLTVIRKLLDLLTARARLQLIFLLVLLAFSAVLEVIGIASIMPFMALVSSPETIKTSSFLTWLSRKLDLGGTDNFLIFLGAATLLLLLLSNTSKMVSGWLVARYQHQQHFQLARRLLANYMSRRYEFFLGANTAELGSTILHHVAGVTDRMLRQVIDFSSGVFVCLLIMVALVVVNPIVALIIGMVLGGSYLLIYTLAHRKLGEIGGQSIDAAEQMHKIAAESMSGIKDLKVLGREPTFLRRFSRAAEIYARNGAFSTIVSQIPRYFLEIIAFGGILSVILYLISQGKQTSQIIPVLALYAFAGYRLLPTLNTMFVALTVMRYNVESLSLIHEELTSSRYSGLAGEQVLHEKSQALPLAFRSRLELRNVTFCYEGASQPSLRNLNLSIEPNTTIGLVGPTGSGKTTAVDLILGLLEPTGGKIMIDGAEITAANRANWQSAVGYVPQHIYLSDDTLARNIAFGVPDAEIDMNAVRRAAAIANLAEFIEGSLEKGYDTEIGERGVRLSGGQRQRIGIARAMYRDPPILVMDEATSALDGVTEESVMSAIHSLSHKKTIILIAHRLSTIKECDVIYQLESGAVSASGSYEALLRSSDWFRDAARGMK